jgi:hypothetical protein
MKPIWKNAIASVCFSVLMVGSLSLIGLVKDARISAWQYGLIGCLAFFALLPLIRVVRVGANVRTWLLLFALGLLPSLILLICFYAILTRDSYYVPDP